MITKIQVTNADNEVLEMSLRNPGNTGFLLLDVDGLEPAKANINMINMATDDGGRFNYANLNSKNIVFTIALVPDYSMLETLEDLRQDSYRYFPIKKQVKVEVFSENRSVEIYGYIESNSIDIFTNKVITQISIVCPSPYFRSLGEGIFNFNGEIDMFEFPFSNESLVTNLIEVSAISNVILSNVFYEGDVETGFLIKIHAIGAVENISIFNETTKESLIINTDVIELIMEGPIEAGDDIIISTVKGSKYAILVRDGVTTNILNSLDPTSKWLYFKRGDNVFSFTAEDGIENLQVSLQYAALFEGV
jgi:hypothetical protein